MAEEWPTVEMQVWANDYMRDHPGAFVEFKRPRRWRKVAFLVAEFVAVMAAAYFGGVDSWPHGLGMGVFIGVYGFLCEQRVKGA